MIGLNENQQYISPRENITVIEKCIGERPKRTELNRPGIIKLNLNCEIYTDKIIVYPKYTRTRAGIMNLPVTNRTPGIKVRDIKNISGKLADLPPPSRTIFKNFNEEFIELDGEISSSRKTLIDLKKIEPVERHIVRNVILGITSVVILIIIICLIKCLC